MTQVSFSRQKMIQMKAPGFKSNTLLLDLASVLEFFFVVVKKRVRFVN